MNNESSEMKPLNCPFCGLKDITVMEGTQSCRAICNICSSIGPSSDSKANAIYHWNTRHSSEEQLREENEELNQARLDTQSFYMQANEELNSFLNASIKDARFFEAEMKKLESKLAIALQLLKEHHRDANSGYAHYPETELYLRTVEALAEIEK